MSSSNNLWRDSDPSDDDATTFASTRKRSSRACDQCRKTKSKCERSSTDPEVCKNCAVSGNVCTYLGPSYKRGPPKGYIHAIEQRWQTIESLLGAIMACPDPGVQHILSRLRRDELARDILNMVDMGPFGPSGRLRQSNAATNEDTYTQIFKGNDVPARDAARLRRQSRISREVVSLSQDTVSMPVPTMEWQDQISAQLASSLQHVPSSSNPQLPLASHSSTFGPSMPQKRRTDSQSAGGIQFEPGLSTMYTIETDSDDNSGASEPTETFGDLSLDENREIRFHGEASGLPFLGRRDRKDDRNEGGIWRLPMARVWPHAVNCSQYYLQEEDLHVDLPPFDEQERLLGLYFTYAHPVFPVVHKSHLMSLFYASNDSPQDAGSPPGDVAWSPSPSPPRERPAQISKLLLLSIFALAARYTTKNVESLPEKGKMWEAGCAYLISAREVLNKIIHHSRPTTCQALLILGHREFGIGSMEQGWLYIGLALRMAQDLGLNRNADKWQYRGVDLFSPEEKQMRKQIWFACVIADEYSSVYMGRPVSIREDEFDTLLPDDDTYDGEPWQPALCDPVQLNHKFSPGRVISCFRASASLSLIIGSIVTCIYPVKHSRRHSRFKHLADLESRLDQWYIQLPDGLRCDTTNMKVIPAPHILFLHIKYWAAVLLLFRAFLPEGKKTEQNLTAEWRTACMKAFDLCQTAASHVSTLGTIYHDHFNLGRTSPFLSAYLLSAGVTHVVTLTARPLNQQASTGLRQCLTALKQMELTWPSAGRAWALLEGAKVQLDNAAPVIPGGEKRKRPVDDAFEQDKTLDVSREAFGSADQEQPWTPDSAPCMQDMSNRMLAHMLGIDISGIEPPTSYYPGYQWWPRFPQGASPLYEQTPPLDLMIPRPCNDYEPGVFDTHVGQQDCPSSGDPRAGMTSDIISPNYFFDFSGMPTSGPS